MKKIINLLMVMLCLIITVVAYADNPNNHYNKTEMKVVTFKNGSLKMAANIFFPEEFDQSKKYPAIVSVHPSGGVKEQTSGRYARRLAEQGFITLAFDATYFGESEGEPRGLEDPAARMEDIHCAVDYLTTLPYVDEENIGVLGLCAGGGYSVAAAQTDRRVKAVATISGINLGTASRRGWDGNSPSSAETQLATLKAIYDQRTAEANGAEYRYMSFVPNEIDENTIPSMIEGHLYYRSEERDYHPNSDNKRLFSRLDKTYFFDAFAHIGTLLTQPLLMIVGSESDSNWNSEYAVANAAGTAELFTIEGATHVALYDVPEYVDQAVSKLTEFFNENLKAE